MSHRILESERDRAEFVKLVGSLKLPVTFEWTKGRDRSLDQNRTMWLWAAEVEQQTQQETADEVQRRWKLHHGVPILRRDSQEFRELYDATLKALPYELKLKAMRLIPVTSEMKVPQMAEFMSAVQRECAEQGIRLTEPAERKAA